MVVPGVQPASDSRHTRGPQQPGLLTLFPYALSGVSSIHLRPCCVMSGICLRAYYAVFGMHWRACYALSGISLCVARYLPTRLLRNAWYLPIATPSICLRPCYAVPTGRATAVFLYQDLEAGWGAVTRVASENETYPVVQLRGFTVPGLRCFKMPCPVLR
eukprot:3039612-Rhodomonas_salina.1